LQISDDFRKALDAALYNLDKAQTAYERGAALADLLAVAVVLIQPELAARQLTLLNKNPRAVLAVSYYAPKIPHTLSNVHSVKTITQGTWWGKGNRNQLKVIALKDTDIAADLRDINAGKGLLLSNNDILAPSRRVYGRHPGKAGIFPRPAKGFIALNQAEYGIFQEMLTSGGLQGNVRRFFDARMKAGNLGLTPESEAKLLRLYEDWASCHK
jgi:hypothetical protein